MVRLSQASQGVKDLAALWDSRRNARPMPAFGDFDPAEFQRWSDWMAALRITDGPGSVEVIAAGAVIARHFGGDIVGKRVASLMDRHYWNAFEALCEQMLEKKSPLYIVAPFYYGDATISRMERIALPCGTGDAVTEVLLYWQVMADANMPTCLRFLEPSA